jgi:class 3 adenylate cyclase
VIDALAIAATTGLILWGCRTSRNTREFVLHACSAIAVAMGLWLITAQVGVPLSWEAMGAAALATLLASGLMLVPAETVAQPSLVPEQPAVSSKPEEKSAPREPRIIVATILHAQLVNLSELLESEEAIACDQLVQSAIREIVNTCNRFGGRIQSVSVNAVQAVFHHDASGNHATQALRAGILARERLKTLANPFQAGEPRCLPDFRIGINTGETLETTLAAPHPTPCIGGEPVEWARKLAVANLAFGSKVLASPSSIALAGPSFECRSVDTLQRFHPPFPPETIVEPLALKGTLDADEKQRLDAWEDGIRLYRNQRWLAARNHLLRSLPPGASDEALDLYLARIEEKLAPSESSEDSDDLRALPLAKSGRAS